MNRAYMEQIMTTAPIPGSSLTSDPDSPAPYERPPEYTDVHAACAWLFSEMIEENNYEGLIKSMMDRIPIMDIAKLLLFSGFQEGKWDVNLLMLLIEPTAYMLLALAERAGIDPEIYREEELDELNEEERDTNNRSKSRLKTLKKLSKENISLPFINNTLKEKLQELPTVDEMSIEEKTPPTSSLLMAPTE